MRYIQDRFWIVWSPQGQKPPQKIYKTKSEAEKAAHKLVQTHIQQVAYVMELVSGAVGYQYTAIHQQHSEWCDVAKVGGE